MNSGPVSELSFKGRGGTAPAPVHIQFEAPHAKGPCRPRLDSTTLQATEDNTSERFVVKTQASDQISLPTDGTTPRRYFSFCFFHTRILAYCSNNQRNKRKGKYQLPNTSCCCCLRIGGRDTNVGAGLLGSGRQLRTWLLRAVSQRHELRDGNSSGREGRQHHVDARGDGVGDGRVGCRWV